MRPVYLILCLLCVFKFGESTAAKGASVSLEGQSDLGPIGLLLERQNGRYSGYGCIQMDELNVLRPRNLPFNLSMTANGSDLSGTVVYKDAKEARIELKIPEDADLDDWLGVISFPSRRTRIELVAGRGFMQGNFFEQVHMEGGVTKESVERINDVARNFGGRVMLLFKQANYRGALDSLADNNRLISVRYAPYNYLASPEGSEHSCEWSTRADVAIEVKPRNGFTRDLVEWITQLDGFVAIATPGVLLSYKTSRIDDDGKIGGALRVANLELDTFFMRLIAWYVANLRSDKDACRLSNVSDLIEDSNSVFDNSVEMQGTRGFRVGDVEIAAMSNLTFGSQVYSIMGRSTDLFLRERLRWEKYTLELTSAPGVFSLNFTTGHKATFDGQRKDIPAKRWKPIHDSTLLRNQDKFLSCFARRIRQ